MLKASKIWIFMAAFALAFSSAGVAASQTEWGPNAGELDSFLCLWLGGPPDCQDGDDGDNGDNGNGEPPPPQADDPTGMWHLIIDFPDMPPFLEILVFHQGGTLTESNFSLHGNSANPFFPFNGSEGHGIWQLNDDGTTSFAFQKMVFDAEENNAPIGFLRVKGKARLDGGIWEDIESNTAIVAPDGFVIIDFGAAEATGRKLTLDLID